MSAFLFKYGLESRVLGQVLGFKPIPDPIPIPKKFFLRVLGGVLGNNPIPDPIPRKFNTQSIPNTQY